ncbi:hypothetical protein C2845_PM01G21760 [Panicum miliaceum]|uniref:Uncharacterized protein n=1 Tax=Panicum miliaceum TaxID=4540 RepID=A0A3L6TMI2_PANMI|nr:hypothetical protein C2845_PM01G21760 [Panicum miliaceum]
MMLGVVNHHVRGAVRRSRSTLITDSANSSSWTTDDEADADAASWTTEVDIHDDPRRDETPAERPTSSIEPPSNTAERLSCLPVPFLVLTPFLLWRRTDQPVSVVSTISLLMSSYLFFCIVSLSETVGVFTIFVYVSHLPLLAFAIRLLSTFAGMTVLYLNTICAAGLCGVAIAERRRHNGSENSVKAVQINDKSDPAFPAMVASLMSLVCAARVLWMCFSFRPEDAVAAIFELSFMAIGCLFSWMLFVDGCLLHGALFSGHTLGMLGVAGLMFFYTMLFALAMLFGETVAAIVPWVTAMATAGLLGYTLTVYQQHKQLQRARE